MSLKNTLKTSLEDVYEDLKTLTVTVTDPSFWRRIFEALKTSFLDLLKLKLDSLFKTVRYCLQHVFIAVLNTSLEDWPLRRVWRLKNVNRPVVLKTYFQRPQCQFSKRVEAPAWRPFQNWHSSRTVVGFSERPYTGWILLAARLHIRLEEESWILVFNTCMKT